MKTKIEHGQDNPRTGAPRFTIETIEDYELARKRVDGLAAGTKNGDADRELEALRDAIAAWDAAHAGAKPSPADR